MRCADLFKPLPLRTHQLGGTMLQVLNDTLPATRPPKRLDKVRAAIRTRHYSIRTEEAYTQWIKRFISFHLKRHLREMGAQEANTLLFDFSRIVAIQRITFAAFL